MSTPTAAGCSAVLRAEALDRTTLLMRDHLDGRASDERLLTSLTQSQVAIVADRANASTREGQISIVTTALLCARMGMRVSIQADNVAVVGHHPPIKGTALLDALSELGADIMPGCRIEVDDGPVDLCVLVGNTSQGFAIPAEMLVRISSTPWSGRMMPISQPGWRAAATKEPFGALAAAALPASEAYKLAVRKLRSAAKIPLDVFDATFAPSVIANVQMAPEGTRSSAVLGNVDFISGGAITHSVLYTLARVDGISAHARVIEPQTYDLSNLNRYAIMRRSDVGLPKAAHLASVSLGAIRLSPIPQRFDEDSLSRIGPLADRVLVGVDHVPSRWLAQRACSGWCGVGATEHYTTMASFHDASTPCVACLHPHDGGVDPRAPTVSFVSFWAGLWLSSIFVRHVAGEVLPVSQQAVLSAMLRSDSMDAIWRVPVPRKPDCRLGCGTRR